MLYFNCLGGTGVHELLAIEARRMNPAIAADTLTVQTVDGIRIAAVSDEVSRWFSEPAPAGTAT